MFIFFHFNSIIIPATLCLQYYYENSPSADPLYFDFNLFFSIMSFSNRSNEALAAVQAKGLAV